MKKDKKGLTRRDFLRSASAATLAGAAGVSAACNGKKPTPSGPPREPAAAPPTGAEPPPDASAVAPADASPPDAAPAPSKAARVVLIRDENAVGKGRRSDPATLERMLDEGIKALLGESDVAAAWSRLFRPDDVVAVKSNQWRFLRTPKALEKTVRERLKGAGVAADRIAISDRGLRKNRVFKKCTAMINARPMRTHHWSGVGSLLKNYVNLHPEPWAWHDDSCANLAGLWDMKSVKGKTRLNILVMLTPLFHGKGPHHFHAKYTWPYGGLLLGTDPVAVDATGLRILEAKRAAFFGKEKPFATPPKHIRVAAEKFQLGVADPEEIELIKLGWTDDILI
jgi:hypothetical protein